MTISTPDRLFGTNGGTAPPGRHGGSSLAELARKIGEDQDNDALGHLSVQRRHARARDPAVQNATEALIEVALLPAPDAGPGAAGLTDVLVDARLVREQRDELSAADMLLRDVSVSDRRGRDRNRISCTHEADSRTSGQARIFSGTIARSYQPEVGKLENVI